VLIAPRVKKAKVVKRSVLLKALEMVLLKLKPCEFKLSMFKMSPIEF
jgi:hypothetical protein